MNYLLSTCGFVCLVLSVSGQIVDEHAGLREKCMKELELQKGELSAAGSSTFLQNPKSKCYLKCFLDGLQLINPDNSFDGDRAVALIDEDIREQARPLIVDCLNKFHGKVAEICEKSFQVTKCLYEANPGIFQQLGILDRPIKD